MERQNYSKIQYLESEYAALVEEKHNAGKKLEEIEKQRTGLEKKTKCSLPHSPVSSSSLFLLLSLSFRTPLPLSILFPSLFVPPNLSYPLEVLASKMQAIEKETHFLKGINQNLEENQDFFRKKIAETEVQLREVKDEELRSKDEIISQLTVILSYSPRSFFLFPHSHSIFPYFFCPSLPRFFSKLHPPSNSLPSLLPLPPSPFHQEQVRDLMFYIEAQQSLSNQSEFTDGQVVVVPAPKVKIPTPSPSVSASPSSFAHSSSSPSPSSLPKNNPSSPTKVGGRSTPKKKKKKKRR